jgi:hypothetical protein
MAVMGWVEVAEATKWTGEPDVDPAEGELTVTPAKDAAPNIRVVNSNRIAVFTPCTPSELGFLCLRRRGYELIYSGCIRRALRSFKF